MTRSLWEHLKFFFSKIRLYIPRGKKKDKAKMMNKKEKRKPPAPLPNIEKERHKGAGDNPQKLETNPL